ncbi:ABC transporter permease [Papillibacter cinnamivorans]|nr:ABC transporter permease [Papillibacter cinnamivorans]
MGQCPPFREDDFEPATQSEKETFIEVRKSMSYWQDAWRRLKKNKVAMVALGVIILFLLFAFVGPLFSPYSYEQQIRGAENLASSLAHPFGTDSLGRDLLVRVMYGSRISLAVGVIASLIVLVIGSIYGSVSGYLGGRVDDIMMRIVELIYSIPDVLVVLLLSTVLKVPLQQAFNSNNFFRFLSTLGPGLISIFIVFGMLYWVGMARILRGQILQLKQQEYVTAARALGANSSRIIRRHLLPNCIGQIIVTTMLQIPSAIFLESFLSFLGLGIAAPLASLGSLCSDALNGIYTYPMRLVFPAVILSILILAFNLFGDGLRDALDPRLKK